MATAYYCIHIYVLHTICATLSFERATLQQLLHQQLVRYAISHDLEQHLIKVTDQAQDYFEGGELRQVYIRSRLLRSSHDRPVGGLNDGTGRITSDPAGCEELWRQHWTSVFRGQLIRFRDLAGRLKAKLINTDAPKMKEVDLSKLEAYLKKVPRFKAIFGRVASASLKAGGEPAALLVKALLDVGRRAGRVATALKGGRIQALFKGKGSRTEERHRSIPILDRTVSFYPNVE